MYIMFTFTSGSNPYIAFTEAAAKEVKRDWTRSGAYIEKLARCMFLIHDREWIRRDLEGRQIATEAPLF